MTFAVHVSHLVFVMFAIAAAMLATPNAVSAKNSATLYSFKGGNDGSYPLARLTQDSPGNLYGTTYWGGGSGCEDSGCGTIFKIAPDGYESVLHSFAGGCDGAMPYAGLVSDDAGNFYGTTIEGGDCNSTGVGTVFKITSNGKESVLYAFTGGSDGSIPVGDLIRDGQGNLYGTTQNGGNFGGRCHQEGCGVVFEITKDGIEKVLHAFKGNNGLYPEAGLVRDAQGNLYGTTVAGGGSSACGRNGCGTVFKLAPDGTESVLYAFQGGSDGGSPLCDLILDKSGNLYGTTGSGGRADYGTVFKLTPAGQKIVLYSFKGGVDGRGPDAGVVMDKKGHLYGTTTAGGGTECGGNGCGTVFRLASDGTESILLTFAEKKGNYPHAGLTNGKHGMLYGTASYGGEYNGGVVFRVKE